MNENGDDILNVEGDFRVGIDYGTTFPKTAWQTISTPTALTRPDFAAHPACEECPLALQCMADQLPRYYVTASKAHEQRYRLPCLNEGEELVRQDLIQWTTATTVTLANPKDVNIGDCVTITGNDVDGVTVTSTTTTFTTSETVLSAGGTVNVRYISDGTGAWVLDSEETSVGTDPEV